MNQKQINEMLASNRKLFISLTGGGSSCLQMLTENGGSSNMFLGAVIPYNDDELSFYIGSHGKSVSREVALRLSTVGYNRPIADTLVDGVECVGIGSTASLVKAGTEREGREHKAFIAVAVFNKDGITKRECVEITLNEKRTRKQEEDIIAEAILALANVHLCLRKAHPFHPKTLSKNIGFTAKDVVNWEPIL